MQFLQIKSLNREEYLFRGFTVQTKDSLKVYFRFPTEISMQEFRSVKVHFGVFWSLVIPRNKYVLFDFP